MKENPDIQPKQQIPLKICYPSHHSDVTDAMKKKIDSYKDLPWPKSIFAEGLLTILEWMYMPEANTVQGHEISNGRRLKKTILIS